MTRGERNNNPGNLRESPGDRTQWVGERATDDDKAFEEFETPADGIRALAVVLLTYERKHGLRTVREIIRRWAPASENDTEAYVESVCQAVGMAPEDPFTFLDPDSGALFLAGFVKAIIRHENGRVLYTDEEIMAAIERAL